VTHVTNQFYLGMPFVGLALFAFFFFASVFVIAFLRAMAKGRTEVNELEQLPFGEEHQEVAR
jgi:hypothetical protein